MTNFLVLADLHAAVCVPVAARRVPAAAVPEGA
jgi:hypothetical protein